MLSRPQSVFMAQVGRTQFAYFFQSAPVLPACGGCFRIKAGGRRHRALPVRPVCSWHGGASRSAAHARVVGLRVIYRVTR